MGVWTDRGLEPETANAFFVLNIHLKMKYFWFKQPKFSWRLLDWNISVNLFLLASLRIDCFLVKNNVECGGASQAPSPCAGVQKTALLLLECAPPMASHQPSKPGITLRNCLSQEVLLFSWSPASPPLNLLHPRRRPPSPHLKETHSWRF